VLFAVTWTLLRKTIIVNKGEEYQKHSSTKHELDQ
jgi:hypothetical protein